MARGGCRRGTATGARAGPGGRRVERCDRRGAGHDTSNAATSWRSRRGPCAPASACSRENASRWSKRSRGLYDITPTWTDETIFEEAHRALDELLPGDGSLAERLATKRRETEIPVDASRASCSLQSARSCAAARVPVSPCPRMNLSRWSSSRVNRGARTTGIWATADRASTSTPICRSRSWGWPACSRTKATPAITPSSRSRSAPAARTGWGEHCLAFINAPSCTIAEAIAVRALDVLLTDDEQIAWHAGRNLPARRFRPSGRGARVRACSRRAASWPGVDGNAAFLLHDRAQEKPK